MDSKRELEVYLAQKRIPNAVIKSLLDNFAHDLAEAQRAEAPETDGSAYVDGWRAGVLAAADRIDPHVTS